MWRAASMGRDHRPITESGVGFEGQLNRCVVSWGLAWHAGHKSAMPAILAW